MSLTEEQKENYLVLSEEYADIQRRIEELQAQLETKKDEIRDCMRVDDYHYHAAPEIDPCYDEMVRIHRQEYPLIVDQVAVTIHMRQNRDFEGYYGVGEDARKVYAALLDGPKTIQQLAEITNLSKAQVRNRLKNHIETRVRKVGKAGRSDLWDVCRVTDSEVMDKIKELGPKIPYYTLGDAMGDSMVAEELHRTIRRLERREQIKIETIEESITGESRITQLIVCNV